MATSNEAKKTDRSGTRDEELKASKKAAMDALDKLFEAKEHFAQAAEAAGLDMKDEAIDQLTRGKAKAQELGTEANEYMLEKPMQTLGIAFVSGFILSQILSRK